MDKEHLLQRVREQCEIGVFKRGEMYYRNGHVKNRRRKGSKVFARVRGRRNYGVALHLGEAALTGYCSCPYYSKGQFCKHIVATGIAFREDEASFVDSEKMREKIFRQEQKLLAEAMAHIVEIYPDLVDDMGMDIREAADFDAAKVVAGILDEVDPLDVREMDLVVRRLKSVLARAEIEFERGLHAAARRIVFAILSAGLGMDERYEAAEIFPLGFLGFVFAHYNAMAKGGTGTDPAEVAAELEQLKRSPYFEKEGLAAPQGPAAPPGL